MEAQLISSSGRGCTYAMTSRKVSSSTTGLAVSGAVLMLISSACVRAWVFGKGDSWRDGRQQVGRPNASAWSRQVLPCVSIPGRPPVATWRSHPLPWPRVRIPGRAWRACGRRAADQAGGGACGRGSRRLKQGGERRIIRWRSETWARQGPPIICRRWTRPVWRRRQKALGRVAIVPVWWGEVQVTLGPPRRPGCATVTRRRRPGHWWSGGAPALRDALRGRARPTGPTEGASPLAYERLPACPGAPRRARRGCV